MTAVAIDGPAGSGKSTVARAVAEALGFSYLDTGALYRAVALAALDSGVDAADGGALAEMVESAGVEIDGGAVRIGGRDVSRRIREADVTALVSTVAAHPEVRAALLDHQRAAAARSDVVMEGRDIGSTVLPDADVKIFLTASAEQRALRRAAQEGRPTDAETLALIRQGIEERDNADESRSASPLKMAPGAIVVDTSAMTVDQVVEAIVEAVEAVREATR